ncbi:MAG: hypothetical protein MPJ24_07440 [Pirellulaceae bacterium]|nr:hypothetical protein [Pirellulaceae bacterium]
MKHIFALSLGVALLLSMTGCCGKRGLLRSGCSSCGDGGHVVQQGPVGPQGYYTFRGPRDFLQSDPPSIGY